MPIHDWSKVPSGLFHHLHQVWAVEISRALNRGLLPPNLTALVEQRKEDKEADVLAVELTQLSESDNHAAHGGTILLEKPRTRIIQTLEDNAHYAIKASRIVIRHHLGPIVAFIEIVSPGNKDSKRALGHFVEKVTDAIEQGIYVLVVDLFGPTARDPGGIHKEIFEQFGRVEFELPPGQDRVLASYESDNGPTAYVETVGIGEKLPAMPLFVAPGRHILVPLEETYIAAWSDTPVAVQRLVLQPA
jgi:hypothetical protein